VPKRLLIILVLAALSLAACSQNTTAPPTAASQSVPTHTVVQPTATPKPGKLPTGFTSEGFPYKGNANSPVTLWEFSEFQ
jgi:ABC-type glycerol-3-phosphate transport system substrate-binding protein